jgi:exoribonuclease-2
MLAEEFLPVYALGYNDKSPALTFKMILDKDSNIINTEIFPSIVNVRRMTYGEADKELVASASSADSASLRAIDDLAQRSFSRRTANGAVNIELPEVHINVKNRKPEIEPVIRYRSVIMVRECMIIAGEGAASWAAGKGIAFPYICQEADIPNTVQSGFAGSMQLRRCMRPRILSAKPGRHQGMGLDIYTQVTSPLRRYTDLLAHMQIRLFLRGGKMLSADELMTNLGAGEAAAAACAHAERASKNHWIMVYLAGKKDSVWDAVALENKGYRWVVIIPSLALETQVSLHKNVSPNDNVKLVLKSVNIPRGEAVFAQEQC